MGDIVFASSKMTAEFYQDDGFEALDELNDGPEGRMGGMWRGTYLNMKIGIKFLTLYVVWTYLNHSLSSIYWKLNL